jgi:PAS domain S-box-containing protein
MSRKDEYSSFFDDDRPLESEPEFEAFRERVLAAEKSSNGIKVIVIAINALVYFLLNVTNFYEPDKVEHHPILAYVVLGLSFLYSGISWLYRPTEKFPVMLASYFSYVSDIMFITLWLYATGGFGSPFYILWYMAIVSVALRFNWRIMWITSIIYIMSYFSLMLVLSHVHTPQQFTILVLRCSFVAVIGHLASLISKETYEQTKQKTELKNVTRSLLHTQRELHEKTDELESLTALLEDKVTERTKILEQNAKTFGLLLDSIPLLTWTTTPEGKVNYYNKAWDDFFAGEVDGNNLTVFVHPDEVEEVKKRWRDAKQTGLSAEGEFRWKRQDGKWVTMQVCISPLHNEKGNISMWIGTATELSKQNNKFTADKRSSSSG